MIEDGFVVTDKSRPVIIKTKNLKAVKQPLKRPSLLMEIEKNESNVWPGILTALTIQIKHKKMRKYFRAITVLTGWILA